MTIWEHCSHLTLSERPILYNYATGIDPEIGEGALLLGMIAAGNAIVLFVIQNGFAPVVAIPMTGDGDKPCDMGFEGENLGSHFLVNSHAKARKIPLIYWA